MSYFPEPWKEAKIITLPKPGKDPKFPQNLRPISFLPTRGKLFEKVIYNILQKHTVERNLLNASQFRFHAHHSTTLQCMRLMDHVTLNFNDNLSTAAVFLDIKKAFDITWHPGLLYRLLKLNFSVPTVKLISSFFLTGNLKFQLKVKCQHQGKYKQGCPKVPSYPVCYITYT
jgi:hypothetical protein